MKLHFLFYLIAFCFELGASFFLFEPKSIYFCLKICPLYCSKREKRDAVPYWEDEDIPYDKSPPHIDYEEPYHPHHYHPRFIVYCKPFPTTKETTTTPKPTTTSGPSGICEFCAKKCGFHETK